MRSGLAIGRNSSANIAIVVWLARLVLAIGLLAASRVTGVASAAELHPLEIVTRTGVQVFSVEEARSDAERERGLMFRTALPEGQGMIFDFSPEQNVSMWMKNTLIPLDMIFIRPDGVIARIAANTVPMSETPIVVAEPMTAVLELAGGRAAQLGIREGDRVSWED